MDKIYKIKDIDLIIDAVAILLGDYEQRRKKAAILILKACLTEEFFKQLMEDEELKSAVKK